MSAYIPPPPSTAYGLPRQNSSCFKWGAAGCGGCLVLFLIAAYLIYRAAGPFIGSTIRDSAAVTRDMMLLREHINRYKADTGKYPDKLTDLVPKYVASPAGLKLTTHPEGPDFTYYKPGPDAQPTDPLLGYTLTITTPDGEKMEMPITLLINGHTRQGRAQVAPGGAAPGGSTARKPAPSSGG